MPRRNITTYVSTCGANWHFEMKNHYSGNFWAASCQHIEKLQLLTSDADNYIASEIWLGRYDSIDRNQAMHSNLL